jgi:hypothetical protein
MRLDNHVSEITPIGHSSLIERVTVIVTRSPPIPNPHGKRHTIE